MYRYRYRYMYRIQAAVLVAAVLVATRWHVIHNHRTVPYYNQTPEKSEHAHSGYI